MPETRAASDVKVSGYTEVRNGICEKCHVAMDIIDELYHCPTCGGSKGELLVAFNSLEVETRADSEYLRERIAYCMRHRHDKIPKYLRTGGRLPITKSKKGEAERLKKLNLQEVQNG